MSTKLNESLDGAAEGAVKGLAADTTQGTDTATRVSQGPRNRDTYASTAPESPCALPALRVLWQAGINLANSMPSPLQPISGRCLPPRTRARSAFVSPPGVAPLPMRPSNTPSPDEPKFWNSSLTAGSSATASAMVRYPRAPVFHHLHATTTRNLTSHELDPSTKVSLSRVWSPCAASLQSGMDWRDGLAGAISGVTTRCVVAPLDVIKIRLQLQASSAARPYAPCPGARA